MLSEVGSLFRNAPHFITTDKNSNIPSVMGQGIKMRERLCFEFQTNIFTMARKKYVRESRERIKYTAYHMSDDFFFFFRRQVFPNE